MDASLPRQSRFFELLFAARMLSRLATKWTTIAPISDHIMRDEEHKRAGMDFWPDRLKTSASLLCQTSILLKAALEDEHRFALLTDTADTGDEAAGEVRDFNRLLATAIAALIDLTAYDNPDQEYPDIEEWFEFKCANVVFGRRTDTFSG